MENKTIIKIKENKPINEIIDTKNKYFDMNSYIQLRDLFNNFNSSNLRLFEKLLNEMKNKSEEERKANLHIKYYFFQIYNFLKTKENILNIDLYSIYYTFQCLLKIILENNLLSFFGFKKESLNQEIDDFSKIIELLNEKLKIEKKKKQNKKGNIKRKNKLNLFRKICGLPSGYEIYKDIIEQKEYIKSTGLDIIYKEKNENTMKYNFKNKNKLNIGNTSMYYNSDDEVEFIKAEDYGGMLHPYGLPTKEELKQFLEKKHKFI